MQDRSPPARQSLLQRTAGPYIWVKSDISAIPAMSALLKSTATRGVILRKGTPTIDHLKAGAWHAG